MTSPLEIEVAGPPESPVLSLRGEIDLTTIAGLRAAWAELPRPDADQVVIDLGGVSFMDSTGLGWLAGLTTEGRTVCLRGVPGSIRKLLEVTGLDGVVKIET